MHKSTICYNNIGDFSTISESYRGWCLSGTYFSGSDDIGIYLPKVRPYSYNQQLQCDYI